MDARIEDQERAEGLELSAAWIQKLESFTPAAPRIVYVRGWMNQRNEER